MRKSIGPKTIVYPTPVWVVGTYGKDDTPNAATVAWGGICCSSPPCVAIAMRAATYTHGNIMERKAFTVNVPSETHAREVDYFGMATGAKENKFGRSRLTPVDSEVVDAPYVEEAGVILECRLRHTLDLGLHTLFVGEIMDVKADEALLDDKGRPDVTKVRPLMADPGNWGYYGLGPYLGQAFSIGKQLR